MIYSELFDKSRLSVMSEAVCAASGGNILYKNRHFKEHFRGNFTGFTEQEKELLSPESTCNIIRLGRREKEFELSKIDLFGEKLAVLTDMKLHSENFPLVRKERLYTGFDTLTSHILIPLFGGRVIRSESVSTSKTDITELMSDFETGYFCIDTLVSEAVRSFKQKLTVRGYRVDTDILSFGNPVCNVNVFDFILVLQTLMLLMAGLSHNRSVSVAVSQQDTACSIIVRVLSETGNRVERRSPETLFDDDTNKKVSRSLMDFCSRYSWLLVGRTDSASTAIALTLPVHNYALGKFRNETDTSARRAIEQVSAVLKDDFDLFL